MTCQERVEMMQRYLDHDLSDHEERELQEHILQCAECAGLFARLQQLDSELAQLPKVTPAYSLVDAIMPQLAELDRLPGSLEQTAAKEPAAAASVQGIPWTRRMLSSWKLTGGAAVAATIIGILIMKEQNMLTQSPSFALKSAASNSADSSKASNAAPETGNAPKAANAGGAAQKKDADANSNGSAPVADMKAAERSTSNADAPEADAHASISAPARTAPDSMGTLGEASPNDNSMGIASSAAAPQSTPQGGRKAASSADASAGQSPPDPSPNQTPTPVEPAGDGKADAQPAPAPVPHLKGGGAEPPSNGSQYHALMVPEETQAPATLKSPDGKLVASVEEQKVVVRQADNGTTVAASTYSWADTDVISLVSFSEDYKLTYLVDHQSGSDKVMFDTKVKTETTTSAAKN